MRPTYFNMFKSKSIEKQTLTTAFVVVAVLTSTIITYLIRSYGYYSYVESLGAQDLDGLRASYFGNPNPAILFLRFVWPCMFFAASIAFLIRFRRFHISILFLILSVWIFISNLQLYYSITSFQFVSLLGGAFETVSIILLLIIFRIGSGKKIIQGSA